VVNAANPQKSRLVSITILPQDVLCPAGQAVHFQTDDLSHRMIFFSDQLCAKGQSDDASDVKVVSSPPRRLANPNSLVVLTANMHDDSAACQ
jgi:hypothetical protein